MILEKLISLICEELGYDEDKINEETLIGELVGDELEIEELAQTLEGVFEIELDVIDGDMTVGELAEEIDDSINS